MAAQQRSVTLYLSEHQQEGIEMYLGSIEDELFGANAIVTDEILVRAAVALYDDPQERKQFRDNYLGATAIDKLFYLARSKVFGRNSAITMLCQLCAEPRNVYVMCRKGICPILVKESLNMNTVLLPVCVQTMCSLAASAENKKFLIDAKAIGCLVIALCNPKSFAQKEQIIRCLVLLCAGYQQGCIEALKQGFLPVLTNVLKSYTSGECSIFPDDNMLTNTLWAIATLSTCKESHTIMMRQSVVKYLADVYQKTNVAAYQDYILSTFIQLTLMKECRVLMTSSKVPDVISKYLPHAAPSVLRRSLQVLSNLSVDVESRATISNIPRFFETVMVASKNFDITKQTAENPDTRAIVYCMRMLSNLTQDRMYCDMFKKSGGFNWLADLAHRTSAGTTAEVVEEQIAHLIANILCFQDKHGPWIACGGFNALISMLAVGKPVVVRTEAARALSNLIALKNDIRESAYNVGIHLLLLENLKVSPQIEEFSQRVHLQLYMIKCLAFMALCLTHSSELLKKGCMGIIYNTLESNKGKKPSKKPELKRVLNSIQVIALTFLSNMCCVSSVASFGTKRRAVLSDVQLGTYWVLETLKSKDRYVQLQALRHLNFCATVREGRDAIKEVGFDFDSLLVPKEGDAPDMVTHLTANVQKLRSLMEFPSGVADVEKRKAMKIEEDDGAVKRGDELDRRLTLVKEFLTSEREYVVRMNSLLWLFARPLMSMPSKDVDPVTSDPLIDLMFRPIEALVNTSYAFLDAAQSVMQNPDFKGIGELLELFMSKLETYTVFARNFPKITDTLAHMHIDNESLHEFFINEERNPRCEGRSLKTMLQLPFERARQYASFLADLAKQTPHDHPEYTHILNAMSTANLYVFPYGTKIGSNIELIKDMARRVKGLEHCYSFVQKAFISEHRVLLIQVGEKKLEVPLDVVLFVMSDSVIVTRVSKHDNCKFMDIIRLDNLICGTADHETNPDLTDKDHCIKLQNGLKRSGATSGYIFGFSTSREQVDLLRLIIQTQSQYIEAKAYELSRSQEQTS